MTTIDDVCQFLETFAPARLAEEWDNVGLLVGSRRSKAERIMTCLTLTPASVQEAVERKVDLVVTHHPLPFRPLKRLTDESLPGRLLLALMGAGVAVHSPHTAFDSAAAGINQRLAEGLNLAEIQPLLPKIGDVDALGSGRYGRCPHPVTLGEVAAKLCSFLKIDGLHQVGDASQTIRSIAVACGSAGSFLDPARRAGCDLLVTGETNFHTCLEAEAEGIALLLPGHYASERFGVEALATELARQFPNATVWPSQQERDPLFWVNKTP
jgi:dinuclear metal center YbgI/SA1388 family protein